MPQKRTAQSVMDLKHTIYRDDVFLSIPDIHFNWLKEIGFTQYSPSDMKVFSRNPKFYKIEDDHIFLILLRPKDYQSGQYDLREKTIIKKTEDVVTKILNNEDIYSNKDCIQSSNDINKPSLILYCDYKYDNIYYDENRNTKQISYHDDKGKISLKINSDSDFYISVVEIENNQLKYIEVMVDGVIKSGEPLKSVWNELSVLTPTLNELFNFEKELTEEMKFLFSAVSI